MWYMKCKCLGNVKIKTSLKSFFICRFWEMAQTFTGLKLQGSLGRFGKTATTDIEGYVEFPDGKVSTNTGLHMFSSDIHI